MTVNEAKTYLEEGQFPEGSMGPKIAASIDFLESGGGEVIITQPHLLDEAIRALQATGTADQITLQRLKKKKLFLKDKIALIEDRLLPDIIA